MPRECGVEEDGGLKIAELVTWFRHFDKTVMASTRFENSFEKDFKTRTDAPREKIGLART